MEGRLEKIKNNMALTNQATLSDPNKTVAELVKETIAAVGENIKVRHEVITAFGYMGCGLRVSGQLHYGDMQVTTLAAREAHLSGCCKGL